MNMHKTFKVNRSKRRAAVLFLVLVILTIVFTAKKMPLTSKATTTENHIYTIESIMIEEGDSLWKIASEHYTYEFGSIKQYISEIKRINNLYSDDITAGCYLIVPYYATESTNQ